MAFSVYPVGANTGFSEESALDSEKDRLIAALGGRMADFVVLPFSQGHFDLTTSGSSYDVDVAAGDAFMGGHLTRMDATETVTVDASATNELFLVVDDAEADNAAIQYTSDGTTPSGQYVLKLWDVTTDGSGVTGTTDRRRYVPFPNQDPRESITGLKDTSQGNPASPSVGTDSTGIKTVTVTFDNPFQSEVFSVVASLDSVSDTAVNIGWIKTNNVTVDGFDIDVKVTKSGASSSTATLDWIAQGH